MLTKLNPYDLQQVGHYELDRMLVAACVQAGVKPSEKFKDCFVANSDEDMQRINMVGGAIRARIDGALPPFAHGDMLKGIFKEPFRGPFPHHFSIDSGTSFRIKEGEVYKVEDIFYISTDSWLVSLEGIKSDHGLIIKYWAKDFVRAGVSQEVAA